MNDMMEYKGYLGSVHYNDEDQCFYGKAEHIRDLVSYEGRDARSIKKAFEESVNDYLEMCKARHKVPDRPFKGSFNVRTGPELHRQAYVYAREKNMNLNTVIVSALEHYLSGSIVKPEVRRA